MESVELQNDLLSEHDLTQIERTHPEGLTSAQIIKIFQSRGVRFSEATFRKYVQLGLLPRSQRVGQKGKHRGSHGVYPCATVRRINSIKQLMASSFTIEEIQQSFTRFRRQIETLEAVLDGLFKGFEKEVLQPHFDLSMRRELSRDLDQARFTATTLVRQVNELEERFSAPKKVGASR